VKARRTIDGISKSTMPYQHMLHGTLIDGQFQLERQLGAGGMGTVWIAQDLRLGRSVAIKFLAADAFHDEHAHLRFDREARMVSKIRSPHVVQVFAQGMTGDGVPYVVMELLEGEDLHARITRSGPCRLPEAGSIVEQICRALTRAHRDGLVHRDIKPHNIFLIPETGGQVFVKLLDFGIAKDIGQQLTTLTVTGAVMGSLLYISPEQLREPQAVGPATDLWSLGVVIYEMLTGRVPFDGASLPELFLRISDARFTPASQLNRELPHDVDAFLWRAIMPDRAQRFGSAEELSNAFLRIARAHSSGVIFRPTPHPEPPSVPSAAVAPLGGSPRSAAAATPGPASPSSRSALRWASIALAIALLGLVGAWLWSRVAAPREAVVDAAPQPAGIETSVGSATNVVPPPQPAAPVENAKSAEPPPSAAAEPALPSGMAAPPASQWSKPSSNGPQPNKPAKPASAPRASSPNTNSGKYGF
jgi:serine/threonine-protein kinase